MKRTNLEMQELIDNNPIILMEAAIVERVRRSNELKLHSELLNAPLIYQSNGRMALQKLYQEYIDIAFDSNIPILLSTPTWRTNQSRVLNSNSSKSINIDAATFMLNLRNSQKEGQKNIKIGGLLGCKNDCYSPEEGLSITEAQEFHSWQIKQLVQGGVDYLIAQTLPNTIEALGIAKAMQTTKLPYIISFVISRNGLILDGVSLTDAITYIDNNTIQKPLGYMVNCSYPSFICPEKQPASVFERLIGYQANASSLDHCELDGSVQLEMDSICEWTDLMIKLNKTYGVKILGGCCGTDDKYLKSIMAK
ncbi:MAG: homocysteine S-methyltransferase family protein [Gammaproteobacteria bacterium]|nr:homocysteine S-methyltransferase family protein [Gammaproteobacteria bacterium]